MRDEEFLVERPDIPCPSCGHLEHLGACINPDCDLSRPACRLCGKQGCAQYACQPEPSADDSETFTSNR